MKDNYEETENLLQQSTSVSIDDALDKIGHGRFQWYLLILISWAVSSDTVEIVGVSFVLPVLECQFGATSFEKGLLNAAIFIGMMVGGITWGALGDSLGRKTMLSMCLFVNGFFGVLSTLLPPNHPSSLWLFIVARGLSGAGVGGSYPVAFSYLAELQPTISRGRSIGILCSCWMFAGMVTASLAWAVVPLDAATLSISSYNFNGGWRLFLLLCTIPALSSAILIGCLLPESPRFLLLVNKKIKATNVINKIASINRSDEKFSDLSLSSSSSNYDDEDSKSLSKQRLIRNGKTTLRSTMVNLVSQARQMFSKTYRRSVILIVLINFGLGFGYYGLLLWLPELYSRVEKYGGSICSPTSVPSNNHTNYSNTSLLTTTHTSSHGYCDRQLLSSTKPYWQSVIVNAANMPGNLISILFIEKIGRKFMLCGSMLLTAVCVIFVPFLHTEWHVLAVTCAFGGISAAGWNAIAIVNTELVPTTIRSSAIGLAGGLSRVGSTLGNLIFGALIDVSCVLPLLIGGVVLAVGGLCGLALPNTTGKQIH